MLELKPGYRVICESRPDVLQLIEKYDYYGTTKWQCVGQVGVITSCEESDIIRVVETDPDAYWLCFKSSYESQ